MKKSMLLSLMLLAYGAVKAQEGDTTQPAATAASAAGATLEEQIGNVKGQVDGLNESYLETKTTVDKLSKIKVGGYLQFQWQHADTSGSAVGQFQGGAFPANADQRFQLRRGRLKTTYDAGTSQYVLEFEARPSGVSLKDAEVILKEPWLNTFMLDLGLQDRPFGFEIPYSSSAHEAPERARVNQIVFANEKDLGAALYVSPTERMGFLQYLNLKGGLFTGTGGYNGGTGDEIDSVVDFIGRTGFKAPFNDLNLELDGGFSYYKGWFNTVNDTLYSMSGSALIPGTGNKGKTFDRDVWGVDGQLYWVLPGIGDYLGGTSIRGEYLAGRTIGTLANFSGSIPYGAAAVAMADRDFMGWYVSWIQNWGGKLQSVIKYDQYDPNTDADGSDVGKAANGKLGQADLKYDTFGFGGIYYWDSNLRITAYYDIVMNEEASAGAFSKDLDDNVFTLRAQVKF